MDQLYEAHINGQPGALQTSYDRKTQPPIARSPEGLVGHIDHRTIHEQNYHTEAVSNAKVLARGIVFRVALSSSFWTQKLLATELYDCEWGIKQQLPLIPSCHTISHFILGQVPSGLANQSAVTWSRTKI